MKKHICVAAGLALISTLAWSAEGASPKMTPIVGPLYKGTYDGTTQKEGKFRIAYRYGQFARDELQNGTDSVNNPSGAEIKVAKHVLGVRYGVTDRVEVRTKIPYLMKEFTSKSTTEDNTALGDVQLYARYALTKQGKDAPFHSAVGLGVKLATGDTGDDSDTVQETKVRTGTGSTDFIVETGVTKRLPDWRFDGCMSYTFTGEGEYDTEAGDVFNLNLDALYKLSEMLNVGMELSHEVALWTEVDNVNSANSGYRLTHLSPQAQLIFGSKKQYDFSLGVAIPVHHHVNGNQLGAEPEWMARLGARF